MRLRSKLVPDLGSDKVLIDGGWCIIYSSSGFFVTMARITRSMAALSCSFQNSMNKRQVSSTIHKKQWKMSRSQSGQVTKRMEAIGVLREATLLQNTAIKLLGTISHKKSLKQEYVSKKKENTTRARKTKKAKLNEYTAAGMDVENAKQVPGSNLIRF